jgi:membrane dipeptidase
MGDGIIEENDSGLSHLGKKFVAEMNRLGMIIDGSHAGPKTSMDALMLTTKPFVFSHSGVYKIAPHARNIRDEQIKAVAKSGGVIDINGLGLLLGDTNASIEKYVDHIDYIIQLVDAQHVGIGLDNLYFADQFAEFMEKQSITHPQACASIVNDATTWKCLQPEDIVSIIELLLQRGYSELDIKAILGENILRLM